MAQIEYRIEVPCTVMFTVIVSDGQELSDKAIRLVSERFNLDAGNSLAYCILDGFDARLYMPDDITFAVADRSELKSGGPICKHCNEELDPDSGLGDTCHECASDGRNEGVPAC